MDELVEELLEIVELPDGEIALRRVDDDGLPLLKICFSPESEQMLHSIKMDIARIMIEAGMDAFAELSAEAVPEDGTVILH